MLFGRPRFRIKFANIAQSAAFPPFRNLPQLAVHESIRKQHGKVIGQPNGLLTSQLDTHRVEIHEPGFEQAPCDSFEVGGESTVVVYAVVEGAQHPTDCYAILRIYIRKLKIGYRVMRNTLSSGCSLHTGYGIEPKLRKTRGVVDKISFSIPFGCNDNELSRAGCNFTLV